MTRPVALATTAAGDTIPAADLRPGQRVYVPDDYPLCSGQPAAVISTRYTHVPGLRGIKLDVEGRDSPLEVMANRLRVQP